MRAVLCLAVLPLACTAQEAARGAPASELTVFTESPVRAHAEPVTRYDLEARLDPERHEIHAHGTITLTNTSSAPLRELWFHRYLNAFKNERSVFLRERSTGFRGHHGDMRWGWIDVEALRMQNERGTIDLLNEALPNGDADDESELGVALPDELPVGGQLTLDVRFTSRLPSVVLRTGHEGSFHMAGQWFLKLAKLDDDGFTHFPFHRFSEFYADFGRYRVALEVPARYLVGATGERRESTLLADPTWRRDVYEADDVHDFAFTAWDGFVAREESIHGVAVRALAPAGHEAVVERELATLRFALPHFAARYGSYPYKTLTVVHPPGNAAEAGGMEYPTLITTGGDPRTPAFARSIEAVTLHEFGHQYFYGLLASNEHAAPFLDEGLNSFAEIDALERWLGPHTAAADLGVARFGVADVHALTGRRFVRDARVDLPAADFPSGGAYGAQVYSRTASLLASLERTFGSERFFTMLGHYTRRFRFGHPTEADLLRCTEEHLGADARAFLEIGLHGSGTLDVAVLEAHSNKRREPAGLFDHDGGRSEHKAETGNDVVSSVLLTRRGALRLPVDLELRFADGSRSTQRWLPDPAQPTSWLHFESDSALTAIVLDPERKLLVDDNWANNTLLLDRRAQPSGQTPLLGGALGLLLAELL